MKKRSSIYYYEELIRNIVLNQISKNLIESIIGQAHTIKLPGYHMLSLRYFGYQLAGRPIPYDVIYVLGPSILTITGSKVGILESEQEVISALVLSPDFKDIEEFKAGPQNTLFPLVSARSDYPDTAINLHKDLKVESIYKYLLKRKDNLSS